MTGKYVDQEGIGMQAVRVICVDRDDGKLPVVFLDCNKMPYLCDQFGFNVHGEQVLFPAPQQIDTWTNIYQDESGQKTFGPCNYLTEKAAAHDADIELTAEHLREIWKYYKTVRVVLDV